MNSQSQASQDKFVLSVLKNKMNGTFLEIGSNHPIAGNNTYLLESEFGWRGVLIEFDPAFEPLYSSLRQNSIYQINDARLVDYESLLDNFPTDMDYLQIDLDVDNKSTIDTLELLDKTVFDKKRFATVTFEHDIYTGNYFNTRERSREIFKKRGYELVFPDVSLVFQGKNCEFEDWYVHPDIVDMQMMNAVRSDTSLNHEEILHRLQ
jgi:hypothetical protein